MLSESSRQRQRLAESSTTMNAALYLHPDLWL
jgi:hypothetical protein